MLSRAVLSRGLRRVLGRMSSSPFVWCGFSLVCAAAVCCVHVARFRASAVAPTSLDATSSKDVDIEVWLESAPGTVVCGYSLDDYALGHAEWLWILATW